MTDTQLARPSRRDVAGLAIATVLLLGACTVTRTTVVGVTGAPPPPTSAFLAGLTGSGLVRAVNAQTGEATCLEPVAGLELMAGSVQPPVDAMLPVVADCGADATALGAAWEKAILDRLEAGGGKTGRIWSNGVVTNGVVRGWDYTIGTHYGLIDLWILPAPDGRSWVAVHISERP